MKMHRLIRLGPVLMALAIAAQAPRPARADAIDQILAKFQKFSNEKTPYGVTDGNPQAATAFLATSAFNPFGLEPAAPLTPIDKSGRWLLGADFAIGYIDVSPVGSNFYTLDLYGTYRFNDKVALTLAIPIQYRDTSGLGATTGGAILGLPITFVLDRGEGASWQLSPWLLLSAVGASVELAQGGYMLGGGLTSDLAYRTGNWRFSLADQFAYEWGAPIGYDSNNLDLNVEQSVSQIILSNGVRVEYAFGHGFIADASLTYTNMLNGAFTDNYFTPAAGLTWEFAPNSGIRVGYFGDFADGYNANAGMIQFYVSF
ncbi:MAG: hypothetical protein ACREJC_08370 [Tepidisphaeraceae bacterium]